MIFPAPFNYPEQPHERKHGPEGYEPYRKFKNWVRDEFAFRCVYCLEREAWHPQRQASFSIDHVEAQSVNPDRISDYDNFVYACLRCNSAKQDVATLDPTKVAMGAHLKILSDGSITALTLEGQELILLLHLNCDSAMETRRDLLDILELKRAQPNDSTVDGLFVRKFCYPKILPDLTRYKPPGGNKRPEGAATCHFQRRKYGTLPLLY